VIVGNVQQYPTEAQAWRAAESFRIAVNSEKQNDHVLFGALRPGEIGVGGCPSTWQTPRTPRTAAHNRGRAQDRPPSRRRALVA
jgi:hypothetical protein